MDSLLVPAVALARPEQDGAEVAGLVAEEAGWSPSVHNTQPWLFTAGRAGLSLHADPDRQLTVADPTGREMLISCGAALFTARMTLRALGYIPDTQVLPDPARPLLVARIGWRPGPPPGGYERHLSAQVRSRRAHRGGFSPLPLAPELLAALQASARRYGTALHVITGEGDRAALAEIVQAAERALEADSAHVRERAAWTTPPGSTRRDGVSATAYPARPEPVMPYFPSPDFALGRGWGLPPLSITPGRSAGVVCLLATGADRPADWISAGQALQRIWLTSAASGVAVALHSQPFELGWTRQLIRPWVKGPGCPQLLLRLGTTIQAAAGVRRPPGSILVIPGSGQPGPGHE
jgi:hypothetical protein